MSRSGPTQETLRKLCDRGAAHWDVIADGHMPDPREVNRLVGLASQNGQALSPDRATRLLTVEDLKQLPPPSFLLRDFIRQQGFNVTYGPSGSGKSFLRLDQDLCIAHGLAWYGQEAQQGPVVYIAAEGATALLPRIEAWRRSRGVERVENFYIYPEAVNFYAGEVESLVAELDALDRPPVLIEIDTVARCMVGGDENSARDMGLFIDNVDAARRRYGAAASVVHHTGKSGELERGSSALRGAADTMLSLKPDGAGLRLACEKQKDAAEFEPWRLHLAEVGDSVSLKLGTDSSTLAPQELTILESVSASFETEWVSATKAIEVTEVPRASVYRGLNSLIQRGLMDKRESGPTRYEYRVTDEGAAFVSSRLNSSHETSPPVSSHPPSLEGETERDAR